ncbi:MAG: GTPase Era [Clostridiales bacterium]|nr:GTPase Era [Clostridiales bacterium]
MYKSCFISIIGKPNAGKSTILNALVGEKVSIVSWRPQTTRDVVTGIMHGEDYQIIFHDTPGLQYGKSRLNQYMSTGVKTASEGADATLYVVDGSKPIDEDEYRLIQGYCKKSGALIVALNKTDEADKGRLAKNMLRFNEFEGLTAVVPLSAKTGDNLEVLKAELKKLLKPDAQYYSEELITDRDLKFMAREIIREKALQYLNDEIPHGIGVDILVYSLRANGIADIEAEIIAEKQSHKPIIIGKGGAMLKKIATAARLDIEKLSGEKVFLKIWVKVREDWQDNADTLKDLGYDAKK